MRWFIVNCVFLNAMAEKITKTIRVITSCITFSCIREKGPPSSAEPMRLAGTWKQYSKKLCPS